MADDSNDCELSDDFPNDSSDNNSKSSKKKRRRTVVGSEQLAELENVFSNEQWPSRDRKLQLASQIGASKKFVSVWFQNKRAKLRKETTKEDSINHSPVVYNTIKLPISRNKSPGRTVSRSANSKNSKPVPAPNAQPLTLTGTHSQSHGVHIHGPVVAGPVSLMKPLPSSSSATEGPTSQIVPSGINLKLSKVVSAKPEPAPWSLSSVTPSTTSTVTTIATSLPASLNRPITMVTAQSSSSSATSILLNSSSSSTGPRTITIPATYQQQQTLVQVPPFSEHINWQYYRPPCFAPTLFRSIINMMAMAEGGIIKPGHPEFDTTVKSYLYGIKISGNSRLIYTKGVGFDFETLPDD